MATMIILILAALAVAALLVAEKTDNPRLRWVAKPLASVCFVALALIGGALSTAYGVLILIGLICCMAGDVLLIPRQEKSFLAGMGAFAFGHLAYAAAFLGLNPTLKFGVIIAIGSMAVIGALFVRRLWPHLGAFRGPVAGYTVIISAMVVLAVAANTPAGGYWWLIIAGAGGFAASDLSVAQDQFVAQKFFNRLWGLPLYYGAQLLLASSV